MQLDVRSDASVNAAAAAATDIDILVNNAGTLAFGDYITSSWETFEADMRTNYFGTLRVVRAFTPQFISRRSGAIANVVSVVGLSAVPLTAGYSASKAAQHSLTQSLRGTLEKFGVTIIGIYPGPVETELAKPVPYPEKATPEHAALNIVKGIQEGRAYIFPDPMAEQVEELWSTDDRKTSHCISAVEDPHYGSDNYIEDSSQGNNRSTCWRLFDPYVRAHVAALLPKLLQAPGNQC